MRIPQITLPMTLLSCLTLLPSATANLVRNGSFEDPLLTNLAAGFDTYLGGQTIGGWTVGGGSVDVVGDNPLSWVHWPAASGHQSLDLNGTERGWIHQDFTTVPGEEYNLRFALCSNPLSAPWTVTMDFLWNGTVVDSLSVQRTGSVAAPGWTYVDYTVTAPTAHARLTFESLVSGYTGGAVIDDVTVNPVRQLVPDSSHPLVMALLLVPVAFHRMRRLR